MLPRCVRLEPFSVQKAIELDCKKTPEVEACLHGKNTTLISFKSNLMLAHY